ncbi:hypothetical protein C8R47DRAFT_421671 [Mycena vitilis]|nr:hypothetical protein C8R47DRAFT_421671 [Mycena vitilis]
MLPPELVELIIHHAWGYISTSSHRHAYFMASWMLVCRDWLRIVLSVVFCDLWITSCAHLDYLVYIHRSNTSFVCGLAGIIDLRRHLARTCRSLTVSVYHAWEEEYASQCANLIQYATTDSHRLQLLPGAGRYRTQEYAVPTQSIATFIRDVTPQITTLHFVLMDCAATYGAWDTSEGSSFFGTEKYPLSLTELHITFAYTSSPPALVRDAPRGTFFPPSFGGDMPFQCRFHGIRRLVVWDAHADFVAFMITACPRLERVESTADFCAEDVPPDVPAHVKDRLVFMRLPRTITWGITGSDAKPIPDPWPQTIDEWQRMFIRDSLAACPLHPRRFAVYSEEKFSFPNPAVHSQHGPHPCYSNNAVHSQEKYLLALFDGCFPGTQVNPFVASTPGRLAFSFLHIHPPDMQISGYVLFISASTQCIALFLFIYLFYSRVVPTSMRTVGRRCHRQQSRAMQ